MIVKRSPPPDSQFGLRAVHEVSPKVRRRRVILWTLVFVAAALTPASFLGWVGFYRWLVEREPPTISLSSNFVGFGGGAQQFTFRIQDRLSGLRSIEVSIEQAGRTVQLFERDYESGTLTDDPSFFVDAKALNIEPGSAMIKFSAIDRSLWRNRADLEQQIILDYDPPTLELLQLPKSIQRGSVSYGFFRATDQNPVRIELSLDKQQFAAERVRSTDVYLGLLTGDINGAGQTVTLSLRAVDAVGNRSVLDTPIDLRPAAGGKNLKFNLQFDVLKEALVRMFERYRSQRRALNPDDKFDPPKGSDPKVMAEFARDMEFEFGEFTEKLTLPLFRSITPFIPWSRHFAKIPGQTKYSFGDNAEFSVDNIPSYVKRTDGYFVELKYGAPVFALNSGRIVLADLLGPAGESVVVDHGFGLYSIYSNLESISVREGDEVERGEPIARVGRTGIFPRDGYQVAFRVRNYPVRADELVDPNGVLAEILRSIKNFAEQ